LQKARDLFAKGFLAEAATVLRQVVQDDRSNLDARNGHFLASCRLSFVLDPEGVARPTRTTAHFARGPRSDPQVTVREENALAALEVMSRLAANPKWLIYLPPTMSPTETSTRPGLLEHPAEAFSYFRREGIERVICEEKHMGSRAVVIVCRDEDTARRRFGLAEGRRTGGGTANGASTSRNPTPENQPVE
jgi:PNKP adenylyltransferase domain, ligase domain